MFEGLGMQFKVIVVPAARHEVLSFCALPFPIWRKFDGWYGLAPLLGAGDFGRPPGGIPRLNPRLLSGKPSSFGAGSLLPTVY
jgi:hypothetical protein